MKYYFLLLIVLLSSYAGIIYGSTFVKRLNQLKEIQNAILILQNEVVYSYTPIPEAIENSLDKIKSPINNIFKRVYELLKDSKVDSVFNAFDIAYDEEKDMINIKREDMEIIFDFAKSLGQTAVYGQDKIFELTLERLKNQISIKNEECMKNYKLYKVLGMCFGIMIIIFLL